MKYYKKAYSPPKSFKRFYEESKSPIALNKIKWDKWMNILARCQMCEEEGVLKEIEMLNEELSSLMGRNK
ncbi:MAG: hypothetical protein A3K16_03320 [Omnitrophica bacterium RIFCSPLOWO2_01_FULL_45_24]|nr:MAG: hypothetical protein A3K16_03320 [Omnitrophica bacterium RIFCSPLOWO2_01_FULL_45_24]